MSRTLQKHGGLSRGHDQICVVQESLSLPGGGGLKGGVRGQRPGRGQGETRWERIGLDQSKAAEARRGQVGRHPGILVDKLWSLMGQAREGGIKDEAELSLGAWGRERPLLRQELRGGGDLQFRT